MRRPIPGTPALQYLNKEGQDCQRCSMCHRERVLSRLLLVSDDKGDGWRALNCGPDLLAVLCPDCVDPIEIAIQGLLPDRHAFPFTDETGHLIDNPRCERGHVLVYTSDGTGMSCIKCDVQPVERFSEATSGRS